MSRLQAWLLQIALTCTGLALILWTGRSWLDVVGLAFMGAAFFIPEPRQNLESTSEETNR